MAYEIKHSTEMVYCYVSKAELEGKIVTSYMCNVCPNIMRCCAIGLKECSLYGHITLMLWSKQGMTAHASPQISEIQ